MRIAVISDIHGNLEAFEAVLADIDRSDIDRVVSLGDNIGYGPDSEEVVRRIMEREIPSVLGNHEKVIPEPEFLDWFNPMIQESMEKILDRLSEESISHIRDMESYLTRWDCRFVHGFPPESTSTYLFQVSGDDIRNALNSYEERLCFVGHTHELRLISADGDRIDYPPFGRGIAELNSDTRYLINVGSVGQPRDGDNRAKYVIRDTEEDTLEVRFVPYDIETVVRKILGAGLPEFNAYRLR